MSNVKIMPVHEVLLKNIPGIWTKKRWYTLFAYIKKGVLYVPLKKKARQKIGQKMANPEVISPMDIFGLTSGYNPESNQYKPIDLSVLSIDPNISIPQLQQTINTCSMNTGGLPDYINDDTTGIFDAQLWIGNIIKYQPDILPLYGVIDNKWLKIPVTMNACRKYDKKYDNAELSSNWGIVRRSEINWEQLRDSINSISDHLDNPVPSYQRYKDVESGKLFYFDNGNACGLFIRGNNYIGITTDAYNILTGESWYSFTKRNGLENDRNYLRVEVLTTANENNIYMKINELKKYLNRIYWHA